MLLNLEIFSPIKICHLSVVETWNVQPFQNLTFLALSKFYIFSPLKIWNFQPSQNCVDSLRRLWQGTRCHHWLGKTGKNMEKAVKIWQWWWWWRWGKWLLCLGRVGWRDNLASTLGCFIIFPRYPASQISPSMTRWSCYSRAGQRLIPTLMSHDSMFPDSMTPWLMAHGLLWNQDFVAPLSIKPPPPSSWPCWQAMIIIIRS